MSAPTRGPSAPKVLAEPCTFVSSRGKRKGEPCGTFTKKRCSEHGARCAAHVFRNACGAVRITKPDHQNSPNPGFTQYHCADCYSHITVATA